jgi:hypothetical protein
MFKLQTPCVCVCVCVCVCFCFFFLFFFVVGLFCEFYQYFLRRSTNAFDLNLLIIPRHISSSPLFSGVYVDQSSVVCVIFCRSLFSLFVFFIMAIFALSVFLWFTTTDYPLVSSNCSYYEMCIKIVIYYSTITRLCK